MNDLILFSELSINYQSQTQNKDLLTIKDYYNCQNNFSIISDVTKKSSEGYEIAPLKDQNTILRAFYMILMNREAIHKRIDILLKLQENLNKINKLIILKNIESIKMQYYFLFNLGNLKKMFSQLIELWKQQKTPSIFSMTKNYPIIDYILIAALRIILVYRNCKVAEDLNEQIPYSEIKLHFKDFHDFQEDITIGKQVEVHLKVDEQDSQFIDSNFLNIVQEDQQQILIQDSPRKQKLIEYQSMQSIQKFQESESVVKSEVTSQVSIKKPSSIEIGSIFIQSSIGNNTKPKMQLPKKLQDLHSCIFFSLIN